MDTHIKQKHEENDNSGDKTHTSTRFQCSYCDCNYARKATLQKHEENCKSVGQFQCPYCECKFSKKPNLKMHIKQKHEENFENTNFKDIFRCHSKVQPKIHDEKPDDLPKELETESESDLSGIGLKLGTFQCDLCTEMFFSETNLITHQELKHDVSFHGQSWSPVLAVPQIPEYSKNFVLHHEESVLTDDVPLLEDFKCNSCTKVFITKDSLLNHEKSVHTENVPLLEDFKCNSCTKVFSTKDNLLNHEKSL